MVKMLELDNLILQMGFFPYKICLCFTLSGLSPTMIDLDPSTSMLILCPPIGLVLSISTVKLTLQMSGLPFVQ